MSDIAHLSPTDLAALGAAFTKWVLAKGHQPADSDWPEILGPDLFEAALEGGYFPPGAYPGLARDNTKIKGVQVQTVQTDTEGSYLVLFVDGKEIAREPAAPGADTVEFAKRHGYDI